MKAWTPGPLKRWLALNDSGLWGHEPTGEGDTPVVRSTDIRLDGSWDLSDIARRSLSASDAKSKRLVKGDLVVVTSSGSASHLGKTAITSREVEQLEPCFANFVQRVRPAAIADSRYVWYLLNSSQSASEMEALGNTTTGLRNLNGGIIGAITCPGPPLEHQQAIADFLDAETARIDALIAKKRRVVGLLGERLQALITSSMRSSQRIPLKRLVSYREGPGIMADDFRDEGVPLIRVAGIGGDFVTLEGCNYLDPTKVRQKWQHFALREGDYVISASATMGIVSKVGSATSGSIPYTGLISFRPATPDVDMEFVRFFLTSRDFTQQIDLMKTGAAIQHFGPTHLDQVQAPDLSYESQTKASRLLATASHDVQVLSRKLEHQSALLEERRRALVTAAVTGQMDVPGVGAP